MRSTKRQEFLVVVRRNSNLNHTFTFAMANDPARLSIRHNESEFQTFAPLVLYALLANNEADPAIR